MSVDGVWMDTAAESGIKERIPRGSIGFNLGVDNEWADDGRDGRTCIARLISQARTGTGKNPFSRSAHQYEQDWQPF